MLACFSQTASATSIPITALCQNDYDEWLSTQSELVKNWLCTNQFIPKSGAYCLVPNSAGTLAQVVLGLGSPDDFWAFGALSPVLPKGEYHIASSNLSIEQLQRALLGWGLGYYQFTKYKVGKDYQAVLNLPAEVDVAYVNDWVSSISLLRDLINTPANDMGPSHLAEAVCALAKPFKAKVDVIVGEKLLKENYPTIYAVGKAAADAPRLIDLTWGDKNHPKLTLVGKGVCFDTGGLDIKSHQGMLLMKKDMGGAAHVMALARMIMAQQLPVRLRLLVPAVENSVSGNAFRPSDVIKTRLGKTVEIGNTDAEGRLILCDALAEASSESPDCIIDFATLTGAARIAMGASLAPFFCNDAQMAKNVEALASTVCDPVWQLPLYTPYKDLLKSEVADINNVGRDAKGGAILAALFLQHFVQPKTDWMHFDIMGWNESQQPGRPIGGEAAGIRAVFAYLQMRYKKA